MRKLLFFLITLSLTIPAAVFSHHSIAPFDQDAWQEIEGTVTRLGWRNPHLDLVLQVTNANGETVDWEIEGDAVNTLLRRGMSREMFAVGQRLRLAGWPSSRGRNELMPINVLVEAGREFVMLDEEFPLLWTTADGQALDTPVATDIFRVWSHHGLIYQRVGEFELTESAQAAVAAFNPYTETPALRCIAPGMPNAILNPYPIEFIREGNDIRLKIEEWNAERLIHMTSGTIPADAPLSLLGYSVGRLDSNVLTVRTARINSPLLDDDGIPMSTQAEIVETFTLVPEENILNIEISVTDPVNLAAPARWTLAKRWNPETIIRPYECTLAE